MKAPTYADVMNQLYEELDARNKPVLEYVEQNEGADFLNELMLLVEKGTDMETYNSYEIVGKCKYPLDYKCDEFKTSMKIAVNQTENGGMTGDSFGGYFYVLLPNSEKYFVFAYSM